MRIRFVIENSDLKSRYLSFYYSMNGLWKFVNGKIKKEKKPKQKPTFIMLGFVGFKNANSINSVVLC